MMDVSDLTKVLSEVQAAVEKLKAIAPKHWKGNDAPNPHHFDAGSIVADAGLDLDKQTAWVAFAYLDGGIAHSVKATMPITAVGAHGGGDVIVVDGQAAADPDFVLGSRWGLDTTGFYHRVVCEFKYADAAGAKHDLRFDGDVG